MPAGPLLLPDASKPRKEPPRGPARNLGDVVARRLCQSAASLIIFLVVALLIVLVWRSWLSIEVNGLAFFTGKVWDPEESHRIFGAAAFIYGTVVSAAIAMLIAVPLGVGTAAFLSEIAPHWLRRLGSFLVEMLAAVPSVVYGFWGMYVLGPALQQLVSWAGGPTMGSVGVLPAGIILAIMIVPYVAAVSFDVCRAVPSSQREAALALGATRWQTIRTVVLPYARPGIVGACFIALGRAVGETMAVTMLIGNSPFIPNWEQLHLFLFSKGDTIASAIANQLPEATYELHFSALVELGLVLFLVTIIINSLARLLIRQVGRVGGRTSLKRRFAALKPQAADAAMPKPANPRFARLVDRLMTGVLGSCLLLTLGPLFLILGYLFYQGFGALNWEFFVKLPAAVNESGGGMANALLGSAMLVGVATLIAVPVGLLAAIYLAEYRGRWLGPSVRFIGELLGGVPSIVIGIFAYTVIIQTSRLVFGHAGFYGWAGAFALAVMMIPIVMRASEEALKLVPPTMRDASYALGASQWQTVLKVTLPAAVPAIITAVFLAVARVVGETAPLLLTAGSSSRHWPTSPNDWMPALPEFIFRYAMSSSEDWRRMGWAAALVLLGIVMILSFGVRLITGRRALSTRQAG
jgi:phosphate transport system permease protein